MINEFKGEYRFLSNFWMCPVQYEGYIYPSSEHAYMAAKTTDGVLRRQIANCPTPADAKKMGRKVQLRDGWEGMKQSVMQEILLDKFKRNTNLTQLLLATGDQQLVEGNWWGDKIWGVCLKTNQGQNLLGKTLMIVRDLLSDKPVQLIIAGGRDFTNSDLMRERLQAMEELGLFPNGVELICGMAKGADNTGFDIFHKAGLTIHAYHPDWDGLGKRAGFVRNAQMGDDADMALIFWDGQSKGTKHMIDYMEKLGKPVYIVRY
jgi:ribA/ribD-fused uncharacterized protein